MLLNHHNEDLASVGHSATKKSNLNISPLGHDRDKLQVDFKDDKDKKEDEEEEVEENIKDNKYNNEKDNDKYSFWWFRRKLTLRYFTILKNKFTVC